ncbi:hypothetical protein NPIL_494671 [Nephila pilipes]|uniref:Uncharacterized protein n=1 Tax=Nephila pilipes TaxID=299642 RepID=A0A8X6T5Y4_NEPPI|nr:hypothetical protein NPIL_494671 [Nephila pilipes]
MEKSADNDVIGAIVRISFSCFVFPQFGHPEPLFHRYAYNALAIAASFFKEPILRSKWLLIVQYAELVLQTSQLFELYLKLSNCL